MNSIPNVEQEIILNLKITTNATPQNILFNQDTSLKILYLNARNLTNKTLDIEQIINSTTTRIHILAITETFASKDSSQYINITNYSPVFSSRQTKQGGGVALFVHNCLNLMKSILIVMTVIVFYILKYQWMVIISTLFVSIANQTLQ